MPVYPDRLSEVTRNPADRLGFVEAQAVVGKRRDPCLAIAPQKIAGAVIVDEYARIDGVAAEGPLAHNRFDGRDERPIWSVGHGGADLRISHEQQHISSVGVTHYRRRPRAIRTRPPWHVAQVERRVTLPIHQIVGNVHAECSGTPVIDAVVGAVQKVSAVENCQIRVGAIAMQWIGGKCGVVHAIRQIMPVDGSSGRFHSTNGGIDFSHCNLFFQTIRVNSHRCVSQERPGRDETDDPHHRQH